MSATPRTEAVIWAMQNRPLTEREEEILNAMRNLEIKCNQYKSEFLKHAEAASIFQCGGSLHNVARLRLGSSTIVLGIEWLVSERDRLISELRAAKEK